MKRVLAIAAVLVAAAAVAVLGTGADDDGGSYKVRAIFNNASFVIPGEDVKIAGVVVGRIDALEITPENKAAIVLDIQERGFRDFRQDANCIVRPQSLIGERFVECTPTSPRRPGQEKAPPLRKISSGPGEGQLLLPERNTTTPVDIDLITNVFRRPYAERLTLILNELGVGLAGRGRELNTAIRKSNPALQSLDQVLNILAGQNRQLADLARDGDTVLAPLARERSRVADFIVQANRTAEATAQERGALEASLQRLPRFLRELRPTMERLGSLSDETIPVLTDLQAQAPNINRLVESLGPFARAGTPALRTLGDAADVGGPALTASLPTIRDLEEFTVSARPLADNLEAITTSLRRTGGVERIMDFFYFGTASINGFDAYGRYLRAGLLVNLCSTYATRPVPGCSANFGADAEASAASAGGKGAKGGDAKGGDPILARTRAVLGGADPEKVLAAEKRERADARADAARENRERPESEARAGRKPEGATEEGEQDGAGEAEGDEDAAADDEPAAYRPDDEGKRGKDGRKAKKGKKKGKGKKDRKRGGKGAEDSTSRIDIPAVLLPGGLGAAEPTAQGPRGPDGRPLPAEAGGQDAAVNGLLNYLLGTG